MGHRDFVTQQEALAKLHDAVALWAVGYQSAADVVRAACDALVADADTPSLRMLAAVSIRHADEELRGALPAALTELGLPVCAGNSIEAEAAALKVLAARVLSGTLSPRELAAWAHRVIGHERLPMAEQLVVLDDEYDTYELGQAVDTVDAQVIEQARTITGMPPSTTSAAS